MKFTLSTGRIVRQPLKLKAKYVHKALKLSKRIKGYCVMHCLASVLFRIGIKPLDDLPIRDYMALMERVNSFFTCDKENIHQIT